jgi:diguanylate cyclase (GGDEF)-like protein
MTFRFTSLRTALLLPSVGLVLIVAAAIGALSYVTGQRATAAFVDQLLHDTTERLNENVLSYIATPSMLLNVVAPDADRFVPGATASIDDLTDFSFAGIERRLWLASGLAVEATGYVYYATVDGRFIGVNRGAAGAEVRVRSSADGQRLVYRSSGPGLRGDLLRRDNFDPKQRPWYRAALARQSTVWSPVYVDATTQSLTVTLAKPVRDSKGVMHGVVATDLPLSQLANYVGKLRVSENGVVFIVDSNGTLVAGSQNAALVSKTGPANTRVSASESDVRLIREAHRTFVTKNEYSDTQKTQRISFDSDGETIDASVTRIGDAHGLNWQMVIAVPRNDHLGALKRTALNNAGIATLAVLLAIVMGLWFSHRIGSDVHRLSEATRLLAQGEAPKPLYVERSDELGVIARSMRELSSALLTDPLTGVLNRATFEKRANAELDRQRIGVATASAALVFIDLNAFKRINDSHGHSVGDAVLALAAQRLSRALRTGDFMGRLGGDEFVLFLHEVADLSGARQVIERCRSQLATPIAVAGIDTRIDAAFGLAMIPADGRTLAALLAHADEDMYRDKPQQRHTYKQIDRRTPHSTRQSIDSQKNRLAARNQQIHRYHGHLA